MHLHPFEACYVSVWGIADRAKLIILVFTCKIKMLRKRFVLDVTTVYVQHVCDSAEIFCRFLQYFFLLFYT